MSDRGPTGRHVRFAGLMVRLHADDEMCEAIETQLDPFFEIVGAAPSEELPLLDFRVVPAGLPDGLAAATADVGEKIVVDTSLYKHLASEGRRWACQNGYLVRIDATASVFHFEAEARRVTLYQPDRRRRLLDAVRTIKGLFTPAVERAGGVQLHSSGVVIDDDAVLLVGDMWQGKTTLLLEMLEGFNVRQLSCDTVVLMPETGGGGPTVFGWPSPFSVSHGTLADHPPLFEFFPAERREIPYQRLWAEGKKAVLTSQQVVGRYGTTIEPHARRVAVCLIVRFEPDAPTRLEPVTGADGLAAHLRTVYLGSRDPIYHNWHRYLVCDDATIERNIQRAAARLLDQAAVYTLTWAPSAVSFMKRIPLLARAHKHLGALLVAAPPPSGPAS